MILNVSLVRAKNQLSEKKPQLFLQNTSLPERYRVTNLKTKKLLKVFQSHTRTTDKDLLFVVTVVNIGQKVCLKDCSNINH